VECFAIHARNLIEFLYVSRSNSDDIRAEDFASGWPSVLSGQLTGLLSRTWRQANKQIAHITMSRVRAKSEDFEWHFADIERELRTKFAELAGLSDPKWTAALSKTWPARLPIVGAAIRGVPENEIPIVLSRCSTTGKTAGN
jgi:lambda repressor-like predicted transcriptional regulator